MDTHRASRVGRAPLRRVAALALALFGLGLLAAPQAREAGSGSRAFLLEVKGAIGPATADYVSRGIAEAAERGGTLVILSMDTPGGLDSSMRDIIRDILSAPVPVVTYVNPSGARAASAGTYILYASHVAAMAPGTNLGAATPVAIGGGGFPFGGGGEEDEDSASKDDSGDKGDGETSGGEDKDSAAAPRDASAAKAINDATAYIRSLAELRDRNADWAERAVREAASLSASEALERNVIDVQASNLTELLKSIDGRTVTVGGNQVTLATAGIPVEAIEVDWRTQVLAAITNPNIALILLMIGVYGLLFEFLNPGALYPGTVGAISLLIGLYALALLPVNLVGAALMLLGVGLMTAEAFAPSFGILGIGGAVALALGVTILIDTDLPQFAVAWPVIAAILIASLGFTLLVIPLAVNAYRRKVVSGAEYLIGAEGEVGDWRGGKGHVFVQGERWKATSPTRLRKGDRVTVAGRDGLVITVEPARDDGDKAGDDNKQRDKP